MNEKDKGQWTNLAIAAAIIYGIYKFAPNGAVKAMALGVGGVAAAQWIPYLKEVV